MKLRDIPKKKNIRNTEISYEPVSEKNHELIGFSNFFYHFEDLKFIICFRIINSVLNFI